MRDQADPVDLSAVAGFTPANPNDPLTPALTYDIAGRDAADRVSQVNLTFGTSTPLTATYAYNTLGRLVKQGGTGYANGGSDPDTYTYDEDTGRLTSRQMRFATVANLHGSVDVEYTYTPSGRLKGYGAAGSTFVTEHTFNGGGSLTKVENSSTTIDLTYNRRQRLKTSASQTSGGDSAMAFLWDSANGRRESQGPTTANQTRDFTWAADGTLSDIVDENGAGSHFTYDGAGQRLRKVVTQSGVTTTTDYTYDGLTLLALSASITDSSDAETARYSISYLYDAENRPYGAYYEECAVTSGTPGTVTGAWFSVLTDLRGDVLELLDSDGNRFAGYRYNVWGSHSGGLKSVNTSAIPADLETRIVDRQELRYAGYAYDAAHDLYYCSARYYDPVTRQFVSRDPAKWDGAQSTYQYCGGNPVLANDPTGEYLISGDGYHPGQTYHTMRKASAATRARWRRSGSYSGWRANWGIVLGGGFDGFGGGGGGQATIAPPSLLGNNAVTTKSAVTGGKAVGFGGEQAFARPQGDLGAREGGELAGKFVAWWGLGLYDDEMSQYMDGGEYALAMGLAFLTPGLGGKVGTGVKLGSKADDAARAARILNPFGRRGGPAHVARIGEAEGRLADMGWNVVSGGSLPEKMRSGRFPDLVMGKGGREVAIQVGRVTKGGLPVARERRALSDLRASREFDHVFFLRYVP